MSDSKLPGPPRLPSIPKGFARGHELSDTAPEPFAPPTPGDLVLEIGELKGVLDHVVGLITSLETRLSRYQLSILQCDHRADVAIDLNRETRKIVDEHSAHIKALEAEAAE